MVWWVIGTDHQLTGYAVVWVKQLLMLYIVPVEMFANRIIMEL